jgi:hypothetical protein
MEKKNIAIAKKIVREYTGFLRKTSGMVREAERAAILSLQKILKLKDGERVLIKEDGSFEIETNNGKEYNMAEIKKGENEKLTLNGRETTAEEIRRQKEAVQNQKGAKLDEVSKGNFRLRLNG